MIASHPVKKYNVAIGKQKTGTRKNSSSLLKNLTRKAAGMVLVNTSICRFTKASVFISNAPTYFPIP